MKQNEFSPGWDEKRVQSVIEYYESQTEDEAVIEDESASQSEFSILMEILHTYETALQNHDEKMVAFCRAVFDAYDEHEVNGHIERPDSH